MEALSDERVTQSYGPMKLAIAMAELWRQAAQEAGVEIIITPRKSQDEKNVFVDATVYSKDPNKKLAEFFPVLKRIKEAEAFSITKGEIDR